MAPLTKEAAIQHVLAMHPGWTCESCNFCDNFPGVVPAAYEVLISAEDEDEMLYLVWEENGHIHAEC